MLRDIFRVVKSGFTNFWRNIWLSVTATLIMVVTLLILTLTLIVFNVTSAAIKNTQERVDISVYMKPQVAESQILEIKSELEKNPSVATVKYISAEEALQSFKDKHANNPVILESLAQVENPLPPTLQIKAKDLDQYPDIAKSLSADKYQPFVDKVNYEDNRSTIERLSRILHTVRRVGLGMVVVFCGIAVLVIFNTIRLTIYNRREEVEIMRLVGATNWYIRWPFVVEAMFSGLFASIITLILSVPIFNYLIPRVNTYLQTNITDSGAFNLLNLFGVQLVVALILGVISSLIAIRKYLKV